MAKRITKYLIYPFLALLLGVWLVLASFLMMEGPAMAQAAQEGSIPTTTYNGAAVPDWNNISFSSLPPVQSGGSFQIPDSLSSKIGYNPSRYWNENTPIDQVLTLGDLADTFGLQSLTFGDIAQMAGLDLNNISLDNFSLLRNQTIASLVQSIPSLGHRTLDQVPILKDLVSLNLQALQGSGLLREAMKSLNIDDYGNYGSTRVSKVATSDTLGQTPLNNLDLSQYSATAVPDDTQVPVSNYSGWEETSVSQVPGLSQVPFSEFPTSVSANGFLGYVAVHDVTYGPAEHHTTPTLRSITGSDQVGFHVQCAQSRGCAYLELQSPAFLGTAGDLIGLHGSQWIQGGEGPGGQMVRGGYGVLGAINGGQEPTGRLPFGNAFKVVLTKTTESTGTGDFGLFFRFCYRGGIDLGCTPYFIGPVPWISAHEKDIVFVGQTQGTFVGNQPSSPPIPADVQKEIDALIAANDPSYFGGGDGSGAVVLDQDCLAKIIAKVPQGDRTGAQDAIPRILAAAQTAKVSDRAQIAYILATVETETNFRIRTEDNSYCGQYGDGCYSGRGYVQLTGRANYQRWGNILNQDLLGHPEIANQPNIAARILAEGMRDGTFTGKKLGNYISGSHRDFYNARQIVNGWNKKENQWDKGKETAARAERYLQALSSCKSVAATTTAGGGNNSTVDHPGKLITRSTGTAVQQRIVNSINARYNESSADGPDGGNLACAYEVNRVLQDALGHKIGRYPDSVESVEEGLKREGTHIGAQWARPGDVVVFLGSGGHIGFCINDGCTQVLSNSSSKARFSWIDSMSAYNRTYGAQGRIYRINDQ